MDNVFSIFDIFVFAFGVYFFYIFFQTKFRGKPLNISNFMPTTMTMQNCKQPEAFTAFLLPRLLLFAVFLILYGAISFLQLVTSTWYYFLFLLPVAFYILTVRQARRFWQ